jgi:subtilisin-like proprotein convertase family protein
LLAVAAGCASGNDQPDGRVFDATIIDALVPLDGDFSDASPDGGPPGPADAAIGLDAAGGPCAETVMTVTQSTPTPLPDLNTTASNLEVSGLQTFLASVTVTTNLSHSHPGDLLILLIAPDGYRVRLTDSNGGSFDNAYQGTVWKDAATENPIDYNYFTVPATALVPETPLGALFGSDPNGTWTLSIQDDGNGDTGTLTSWSMTFTTYAQTPLLESLSASSDDIINVGDNQTITDTITLGAFDLPICKVQVNTLIQHTYDSDLIVTLIDPSDRRIKLTENFGASYNDNFLGTIWRDDADAPVADYPFGADGVVTPLTPYYGLSAEFGADAAGTWTLEVHDDGITDTGQLQGWTLDAIGCSCN